jgi:glucokinase
MFKYASAIGVDIGRNTLKIAIVKFGGEFVAVKSFPLSQIQSRDYIISKLLDAIIEIRQTVAPEGINPICIGVSAKGFIEHKTGVVLGPERGIENWKNVPLAKIINQETGLPAYVGNDANMMTIAEHQFGVAKGASDFIYVSLRTGIGGGIFLNGKLYRGVNNAGGEFGQMIINYDKDISNTGIKGSFEHLASASAVVRRYYEETGSLVSNTEKPLSCKNIFEMSYEKSPIAVNVVKENAELVGIGLANLITIFAPEIIVIGGGMSEANDSYFEMVKESAFANSLENCRSAVRIERSKLGSGASLIGAGYYSLTRLAGKAF